MPLRLSRQDFRRSYLSIMEEVDWGTARALPIVDNEPGLISIISLERAVRAAFHEVALSRQRVSGAHTYSCSWEGMNPGRLLHSVFPLAKIGRGGQGVRGDTMHERTGGGLETRRRVFFTCVSNWWFWSPLPPPTPTRKGMGLHAASRVVDGGASPTPMPRPSESGVYRGCERPIRSPITATKTD